MIRHHHRITHAVAVTLALTAIAAAPASASSAPAATGPCSEVCAGGGYGTVNRPAATPTSTGPCSEVCSGGGYGTVNRPAATTTSTGPRSEVASSGGYDVARVPPTVVRIASGNSGFDWADAGIGAAATLGFVLAATGGTLLLAHRRTRSRTAS